jgi:redox-sensitive bicupin YhaK (pirin superfamily)
MKSVFHPAQERGHANHGWLDAHHSFSFASWYEPSRMHFGALRVLNDDIVAAGAGFGMHPHRDMEIITVPLSGSLQHRDDMGNGSVIGAEDVQVMSAGTGVYHSEFNPSSDRSVNLFQLWIFPKEKGIAPRYDQRKFLPQERLNRIQTLASGFPGNEGLYIHQDACVSRVSLEQGHSLEYPISNKGNGAYVMVIEGESEIGGSRAQRRDAVGIWDTDTVRLHAVTAAELLIIDIPMN